MAPEQTDGPVLSGDNATYQVGGVNFSSAQIEKIAKIIGQQHVTITQQINIIVQSVEKAFSLYYPETLALFEPVRTVDWSRDNLCIAFNNARPLVAQSRPIPEDVSSMIVELARLPHETAQPLPTFVCELAQLPEATGIRAELEQWLRRVGFQPAPQVEHPPRRSQPLARPGESVSLLLIVKPNAEKPEYEVRARLFIEQSHNRKEPYDHYLFFASGKDVLWSIREELFVQLEKELDGLLKQVFSHAPCCSYAIELFVPMNELNIPADAWRFERYFGPDDSELCLIGQEYPVMLRSSERLDLTYIARNWVTWVTQWHLLEDDDPPDMYIVDHDSPCDADSICGYLSSRCFLLGLVAPPPPYPVGVQKKTHPFRVLLRKTLPLAIWPRQDVSCGREQISELLKRPGQIRNQVKDLRGRSQREPLGAHLVLLLENPYHLPKEYRDPTLGQPG